jgi:hypothetical protein
MSMSNEIMQKRTEDFFRAQENLLLNYRDGIFHSLSSFMVRQPAIQQHWQQLFSESWLNTKQADVKNFLEEALKNSKSFLKEVHEMVSVDGTFQRIVNTVFTLFVDAYLERFIIVANQTFKLKLFPAPAAIKETKMFEQKFILFQHAV